MEPVARLQTGRDGWHKWRSDRSGRQERSSSAHHTVVCGDLWGGGRPRQAGHRLPHGDPVDHTPGRGAVSAGRPNAGRVPHVAHGPRCCALPAARQAERPAGLDRGLPVMARARLSGGQRPGRTSGRGGNHAAHDQVRYTLASSPIVAGTILSQGFDIHHTARGRNLGRSTHHHSTACGNCPPFHGPTDTRTDGPGPQTRNCPRARLHEPERCRHTNTSHDTVRLTAQWPDIPLSSG